jgi:SAM-dependent methyltransferase
MHDYSEIFSARARQYHYAMQHYPEARDAEFRAMLEDLPAVAVNVLDVPSGGGYLHRYLAAEVRLSSCDFSEGFAQTGVPLASPAQLPFADAGFDAVLSLTGLHHVPRAQQALFLVECARVLKQGGRLLIGEVWRGSPVDAFLNDFVHQHNSQGHVGEFLDTHYLDFLQQSGFANVQLTLRHYHWHFACLASMIDYCRNMFGIDQADDAQIEAGLRTILNYRQHADGHILLPWQLVFYQAEKR